MSDVKDSLEKISGQLDKLDTRIDNIDITLAKQSMVLEEHQRRSIANEKNLELLRREFKPIQKDVHMVHGALKFLGLMGLILTIYDSIKKFIP